MNRLTSSLGQENSKMINDFLSYTKTLDDQRNQSIQETLPELCFLLEEAGYKLDSIPSIDTNHNSSIEANRFERL